MRYYRFTIYYPLFLRRNILDSKSVAKLIVDTAVEKKGANILMLAVEELTTLTDYFVICEGRSERQLRAINDAILDELKNQKVSIYHKEGTPESGWILLDYGNVIAHIFSPERRSYYQLEQLWKEAPTVMKIL
ncbi:MAG: ribosome silencing factor [Anaerolineaceae bacterium 4572_5.2]|nr:MAG: ribosome silencing factor [Anaerolineaceae bacterium 4572_5.2]